VSLSPPPRQFRQRQPRQPPARQRQRPVGDGLELLVGCGAFLADGVRHAPQRAAHGLDDFERGDVLGGAGQDEAAVFTAWAIGTKNAVRAVAGTTAVFARATMEFALDAADFQAFGGNKTTIAALP
jgi:hypothetical protein